MFPSTVLSYAGVTEIGIEFVQSLMNAVPGGRLTAETALEHAWMQPPSEILSMSEVKPLPAAENDQNPAETDKQLAESDSKPDDDGSETLRPRIKTKGTISKAATVEDYNSTDEYNPPSPLLTVARSKYRKSFEAKR